MINLPKIENALMAPQVVTSPAPWAGHIPFAMWLISILKPKCLVELGTYSGVSYLSFCQAVSSEGLSTKCFAVDTWEGDIHAGYYGDHVYQTLRADHDHRYSAFSTLLRKTFDAALSDFPDRSIDFLHIDGLHTYDAVKHDFESWRVKLSSFAVVLFHDINVYEKDFGVYKFWAEIKLNYPSCSFGHSNGLGVLFVGENSINPISEAGMDVREWDFDINFKRLFSALGLAHEKRGELHGVKFQLKESERLCDAALMRLKSTEDNLQALNVGFDSKIRLLDDYKKLAEQQLACTGELLVNASSKLCEAEDARAKFEYINSQQHNWILSQDQKIIGLDRQAALFKKTIATLQSELDSTFERRIASLKLRLGTLLGIRTNAKRISNGYARVKNALRYIRTGNYAGLLQRIRGIQRDKAIAQKVLHENSAIGILSTPHTLFVALAVQRALEEVGLRGEIVTDLDVTDFPADFYIVICAQMFRNLPAGEKRIVFQMEQTVSDRWFDAKYLHILENSLAVFEYSAANLPYLASRGIVYPHIFYVPLGANASFCGSGEVSVFSTNEKSIDVLFYGDVNSPRRKEFLRYLKTKFNVTTVGNSFGDELRKQVVSAKVVVNIHYYENALLESTRIFECLSLGARVVSETAADVSDYPGLDVAVRFVPVGDMASMADQIAVALKASAKPVDAEVCKYLEETQQRFQFMLLRGLLALGVISYSKFLTATIHPIRPATVLSLPETLSRRAAWLANPLPGAHVFNGLRARPGWIGCAMSYKYICAQALTQGLSRILVCEDDALWPENYSQVQSVIDEFLTLNEGRWDIFVGIISSLHADARVLDVQECHGLTFVTIDKMTSMVFNIYSPKAMNLIANWNETWKDDQCNTIDRYLENTPGLRVVTLLEPLFGHRDDQSSTLWGFQNTQYNALIDQSRVLLHEKVHAFRAANVS